MLTFTPQDVDIGKPEENPGIIMDPLQDPVPRENPREPVGPIPTRPEREPELVPA